MKKVSIIIPIYNISEYIEECVDSLWKQTYHNLEIILINDGSTDDSGKICDKIAKKDIRIKVIHQKNGGLSEARNKGIDLSSGDYIFFLDGDDYIKQDTIETLVYLLENNNADISVVLKVGHNDITGELIMGNKEKMLLHLFDISAIEMWGKLYKREIFQNIRFPVGKKHEDLYVLPNIIFHTKKVVVYQKGYYYYRQRENSVMGELRKGHITELIDCCLYGMKHIKNLIEDKEYILKVQKRYLYMILWYYKDVIGIMDDKKEKINANKEIARFYKTTLFSYLKNHYIKFTDKMKFFLIYLRNK